MEKGLVKDDGVSRVVQLLILAQKMGEHFKQDQVKDTFRCVM